MISENLIYPNEFKPFIISKNQIITPICTRGYTGAVVIKLVLEKMIGQDHVRSPYGIIADPKFGNSNDIIERIDVTQYDACDEFEKVFGFTRNKNIHNAQTIVMDEINIYNPVRNNKIYYDAIQRYVWKFPTDKQKVFIIMTMDEKEIRAVMNNLEKTDILVIFSSYNLVAYPQNGIVPFSVEAYMELINKIKKYFVLK